MSRIELIVWLKSRIAERKGWRPRCSDDHVWINWAYQWLRQLEN